MINLPIAYSYSMLILPNEHERAMPLTAEERLFVDAIKDISTLNSIRRKEYDLDSVSVASDDDSSIKSNGVGMHMEYTSSTTFTSSLDKSQSKSDSEYHYHLQDYHPFLTQLNNYKKICGGDV